MPKRFSQKQILNACRMSFEGISNSEIAVMLNVTDTTVSNWRRLKIWQEFEAELVDAYKQQVLESGFTAPTLATPAHKVGVIRTQRAACRPYTRVKRLALKHEWVLA